ncbi:pilin, partial [Patescibacteria group bacterium]|nr:pilin [Patescibacteria group bacterium]
MKNVKKIFLIVFLSSLLLLPLISLAGSYEIQLCDDSNSNGRCDATEPLTGETQTAIYDGLVPCGKEVDVNGGTRVVSCKFCHFFVMFKGIIDFVRNLAVVIAVLMFTIGGFMFFFAGTSPDKVEQLKKILTTSVQGLVIIFAAWLAVDII